MFYTYRQAMSVINKQQKEQVNIQDIRNAVAVMNKKHSSCVWTLKYNDLSQYSYITIEGIMWLQQVYFNRKSSLLCSDVAFFEKLIKDYANYYKSNLIEYQIPPLIKDDMTFDEFAKFVGRKKQTVQKKFYKLPIEEKEKYFSYNRKKYISKITLWNLCKKHFKRTYLKYLENIYNTAFWNDYLNRICIYPDIEI